MSLGKKIKEFRVKKGLTQKQLADYLYVTPQALSRWENDDNEPNLSTLVKLADLFEVTVDCLLERKI